VSVNIDAGGSGDRHFGSVRATTVPLRTVWQPCRRQTREPTMSVD
jgi:hypothetical protein